MSSFLGLNFFCSREEPLSVSQLPSEFPGKEASPPGQVVNGALCRGVGAGQSRPSLGQGECQQSTCPPLRPRVPAEGVQGSIWSLLMPDLHLPEIHCQQVNPLADVLEEWLCDEQRRAEGVCVLKQSGVIQKFIFSKNPCPSTPGWVTSGR